METVARGRDSVYRDGWFREFLASEIPRALSTGDVETVGVVGPSYKCNGGPELKCFCGNGFAPGSWTFAERIT